MHGSEPGSSLAASWQSHSGITPTISSAASYPASFQLSSSCFLFLEAKKSQVDGLSIVHSLKFKTQPDTLTSFGGVLILIHYFKGSSKISFQHDDLQVLNLVRRSGAAVCCPDIFSSQLHNCERPDLYTWPGDRRCPSAGHPSGWRSVPLAFHSPLSQPSLTQCRPHRGRSRRLNQRAPALAPIP